MKKSKLVCVPLLVFLGASPAFSSSVIGKTWFANMTGISATDEERTAVDPIGTVGFFTDAENENNVYYIPPFVPVEGISGTLFVNAKQIERAEEVLKIRKDYSAGQLEAYKSIDRQVTQTRLSYNNISEKLASLPSDQEYLRPQIQAILTNLKSEMDVLNEQFKSKDSILPPALKEIYADQMQFALGSANVTVDDLDLSASLDQGKAAGRLNASYGGSLTVNMVAGLTADQLTAIRKYKSLRAAANLPAVNFAMLPVQTLSWTKLAETGIDAFGGVPLFRGINGGGNLQGATTNIDLTLDAARTLGVAPPPFIIPVGTSASILQTLPPFTAKLDCVIDSGWFFKGRTDVMDGLIIYNNDITQKIVMDDFGSTGTEKSPCTLSYDGGGHPSQAVREAAIKTALDLVLRQFETLGIQRSNLSSQERRNFHDRVQSDIAANRHSGANKGWASAISSYAVGGWAGLAVGVFSQASNFYWHTDKRNITSKSKVEIHTLIKETGNSMVKIDLPMQVCIAWHPESKAYIRCTTGQVSSAMSLTEASKTALKSPECASAETSKECGEIRGTEAPRNPINNSVDLPVTI